MADEATLKKLEFELRKKTEQANKNQQQLFNAVKKIDLT